MRPLSVNRFPVFVLTILRAAGVLALATLTNLPRGFAQTATSAEKFEVAVVRPAVPDKDCVGRGPIISPGAVTLTCISVFRLVERAYGLYANGRLNPPWTVPQIEGAPRWTQSEGYYITAKADNAASRELMNGPMLQALLEDRFKVKVHRETRELPVYSLTIAKGGSKLEPFKEGSCIPIDYGRGAYALPPPQKFCGGRVGGRQGFNVTLEAQGASLIELGYLLQSYLDRPIVDKSGLTGRFDAHMEFWPDQTSVDPANGPSVFTALREQLGLTLQSGRGPLDVLVIDHVEKPSEN